jgi:hypothetical protein
MASLSVACLREVLGQVVPGDAGVQLLHAHVDHAHVLGAGVVARAHTREGLPGDVRALTRVNHDG